MTDAHPIFSRAPRTRNSTCMARTDSDATRFQELVPPWRLHAAEGNELTLPAHHGFVCLHPELLALRRLAVGGVRDGLHDHLLRSRHLSGPERRKDDLSRSLGLPAAHGPERGGPTSMSAFTHSRRQNRACSWLPCAAETD